jgi:hypothetical protein
VFLFQRGFLLVATGARLASYPGPFHLPASVGLVPHRTTQVCQIHTREGWTLFASLRTIVSW